jgi:4-alpha-glucanotransferase
LSSTHPIERLLRLRGIEKEYLDYHGQMKKVPDESLHRVLKAMGHTLFDPRSIEAQARSLEDSEWRQVLPPVIVCHPARQGPIEITVAQPLPAKLRWRLQHENGGAESGELRLEDLPVVAHRQIGGLGFCRLAVRLPFDLMPGYHDLFLMKEDGSPVAETRLIAVPEKCWEPDALAAGERIWGLAIQLYSLQSARNWGIGDFRDLQDLIGVAAQRGIDVIGLSPLHALFPARPELHSPYSPASRRFLSTLYIAPELVPEFEQSTAARTLLAEEEFRDDLERLRSCDLVDYEGVGRCKDKVLRLLFAEFEKDPQSARQKYFSIYIKNIGQSIENIAIYYAIDREQSAAGKSEGWRSWPQEYRNPGSRVVQEFKQERKDEIRYHMYSQWIASQQLAAVEETARLSGMRIGLYRDLAVGANGGGADTWMDQALYVDGMNMGAPPDALAPHGQDWCLPPMSPDNLRSRAYQPFVELLRENMPEDGALRIDHVMALDRLWWVPEGLPATDGSYVNYCLDDLMGIVALESQRRRCLVIGEDLGTVPETVRTAMHEAGMYSYRVLVYEQDSAGRCRRPEDYPRRSVVTITTHDLPPLAGIWNESDIRARRSLGQFHDEQSLSEAIANRSIEKARILQALCQQGLLDTSASEKEQRMVTLTSEVLDAIQIYVARSAASLMIVRPEDWLGMEDQFNLPGTDREYPNWQRKLTGDLADLLAGKNYEDVCDRLRVERRREPVASS